MVFPVVLQTILMAGTTLDLYRRATPVLLPGTSEYITPETLLYVDIPCRRVQTTNDTRRNTYQNSALGKPHEEPRIDAKFHIPYYHNGVVLVIDPELDIIEFEGIRYEVIREKRPSGGNISGLQESYITLYCSECEA